MWDVIGQGYLGWHGMLACWHVCGTCQGYLVRGRGRISVSVTSHFEMSWLNTHIHTYTHTHIHTYAHTPDTHMRTYAHAHIRTYAHTHIHTYTHTHIRT